MMIYIIIHEGAIESIFDSREKAEDAIREYVHGASCTKYRIIVRKLNSLYDFYVQSEFHSGEGNE